MLKIIFGNFDYENCENYIQNPGESFALHREYNEDGETYLLEDINKEMIKDVDKSEVLFGYVIKSPIFGLMPPEYLSQGVRTLMMINKYPDKICNANYCGDNCSKWLLKIAEDKDIIINLGYLMDFGEGEFEIQIINTGKIVRNQKELLEEAKPYYNKRVKLEEMAVYVDTTDKEKIEPAISLTVKRV